MRVQSSHTGWILGLFAGLSSACGTEVGNGRRPPTLVTERADSEAPTTGSDTDESGDTPVTEGAGGFSNPLGLDLAHLLVPCASPFAQLRSGSFLTPSGSSLEVTASAPNAIQVAGAGQVLTIVQQPSAEAPFAIVPDPRLPASTLSCVSTTTRTDAAETIHTAIYSDGYRTVWVVGSGMDLNRIEVQFPSGQVKESLTRKP